ncbi:MAG TPA: hypothetical protein VHS99_17160 [Chloroflexota bacterium]|jgi:hypothetical protein|nr:hypothetical protein [Chloroflexota bacterium]
MFLFRLLFWLLSLPFRIVFWVVGLVLWVVFLPVRLVLGLLGLIGFGRLLSLGTMAAVGYFVYRLLNESSEGEELTSGQSAAPLGDTPAASV